VVRFHWAIRTGSEHDLLVVHIRWAVQIVIELKLFVTGVQMLLLAVQMVYSETNFAEL
jgi:hypothetical protein